ncbi:MAG: RagB/SusD family nutrient uptake outer membrane protein [Bacteroidales bacterium]|nr:RagB/SusD family nutrient uptake outer membrane protein [Bacteroidales bacterium]
MKKILSIIALGAAFAFAVSCDLSEYDPNSPELSEVFSSETKLQYVLNDFYDAFPSVTGAYSSEPGKVDYFPKNAQAGRYQKGYDASASDSWGSWEKVRRLNYLINMLHAPECTVSTAAKENFEAQARLFRAYSYFGMVKEYGDVPWFDRVIGLDEPDYEYKERDSRDDVMKYILEDLDYAIAHITATSPDATCVTKEVAQFIKMRVCLYEASFRKYNGVTASVTGKAFGNYTVDALFALAAESAKALMDSGKYSLVSDYRKLFTEQKLQLSEVILGAQTSATIKGSQNNYFAYTASTDPKTLTRSFINTYLMKNGSAYTDKSGYALEGWADEMAGRDPRLAKIVRTPGYKYDGQAAVPDFNCAPLGYQVIKFCLDQPADKSTSDPDEREKCNTNSTPVFRYAEVLLSYAEAKAELDEMTDDIWAETVGAIRKRAGITDGTASTGTLTTKPTGPVDPYLKANLYKNVDDPVIMEIRRERGCELVLEGQRHDDIYRWGCGSLMKDLPWDGIVIDALDKAIDLDGDGRSDVYFCKKLPKTLETGVSYIIVNDSKNTFLTATKVGSKQQLGFVPGDGVKNVDKNSKQRYWEPKFLYDAIPYITVQEYKAKGYTITQNPGY